MDPVEKMLRSGAKRIITGRSPGETGKGCGAFLSSSHPAREVCFVLEGRSRYMLNGKVYESVPGSFFLIDSWENHAFGYLPEDHDLLHFWGHLDGGPEPVFSGGLIKVGACGQFKVVSGSVELPPEYGKILSGRWDMLNSEKEVSPELAEEYMRGPVNAVLDAVRFRFFRRNDLPREENRTDPVVESIKKFIRMSNARGCSLKRLEQVSGCSRFYLSHRFRASEGCSVGEYIDRVRAEFTSAALRRGMRQKEIAYELGFSSPSNFWNWLRKHREECGG